MIKLGIIIGSTRPGRKADKVAQWVHEQASKHQAVKGAQVELELVDIADYALPLLDEPKPPSMGNYQKEHTKKWAAKIAQLDGFIFVTPEYNHGTSGALKNAIDFVYGEWNNKAAGFVSYGSAGGTRAVEQLRLVMTELQIADVRSQVMFMLTPDFKDGVLQPAPHHEKSMSTLLDQLIAWSTAMKTVRAK